MLKKTGMLSQHALAFTLIGAVLVGALGAVLALAPFHFSSPAGNVQAQPGLNSVSGASQEEAATATQQALITQTPATASVPTPTSTPIPTLRGTVVSVNTGANQFVVRQGNGTLTTVVVTGQTTYQGLASSLGTLKAGWRVRVTGRFQGDGTFKASSVNAFIDD